MSDRYEILRHGGGGAPTTVICGVVRFDHPAADRLVTLLPSVIAIDAWSSPEVEWIQSTLRLMAIEARELRPGGETVIICEGLRTRLRRRVTGAPQSLRWLHARERERLQDERASRHAAHFRFLADYEGTSLRSLAEPLGYRGLRMVMRYAHLSPACDRPSNARPSQSHGSLSVDAWLCESILAGGEIDGPDEPLQESVADETVDAHTAEALIAGRTHYHQRPFLHERAQPERRW